MRVCQKSHASVVFEGEHCPACTLIMVSDAMMKKLSEIEEMRDMQEALSEKCKNLNSEVTYLREALGVIA